MSVRKQRASPGYSYRLCHGCQREGQYPHNTLCGSCQQRLAVADAVTQAQVETGAVACRVPGRHTHWYRVDSHEVRDALGQAWLDLLQALAVPTTTRTMWDAELPKPLEPVHGSSSSYGDGLHVTWLPAAVVAPLTAVVAATVAGLRSAYQNGYREGTDIIKHAMAGRMDSASLDKAFDRREGSS